LKGAELFRKIKERNVRDKAHSCLSQCFTETPKNREVGMQMRQDSYINK